jgi:excisionase family DNA binding protein
MTKLLTIQQTAEKLGLAVGTVYHYVSERRIPVVHLSRRSIRFDEAELDRWISSKIEREVDV